MAHIAHTTEILELPITVKNHFGDPESANISMPTHKTRMLNMVNIIPAIQHVNTAIVNILKF